MSVSFSLPHAVVLTDFIICRVLCACTTVSPRTFECLRSGVNRVQVVLSGFSVRLLCFVHAKTLCRYGCMYFLAVT